jgi:hypothetical protein
MSFDSFHAQSNMLGSAQVAFPICSWFVLGYNTEWAQMTFKILEFYFEAVNKGATSKGLHIKLKLSNFILPFTGVRCILVHHW